MIPDDFTLCVAGRAGDGSYSTAAIFAKVAKMIGYYVHEQRDVQSNIKGLTSAFYERISESSRYGKADDVDILIAFDGQSFNERIHELSRKGIVIYDTSSRNPTPSGVPVMVSSDINGLFFPVPMADLAREALNDPIMRNTIALGILSYLLGIDGKVFRNFIEKQYGTKKHAQEIVASNLKAYEIGEEYAKRNNWQLKEGLLVPKSDPGRLFILGDELIAFGAIVAGCRFFAGYPITPASEIFETMMAYMNDFKGVAVQIESEIAVANLIAGAAYAGTRAMTATSGPGFSLMQEAISACGGSETPIVIVNVQRGGPSSGLPTRTSQEDLNEAIYGGHGDFPRIVLSPATPEECFYLTIDAFNLAEKYQCPVIILSEQCVGQARYTLYNLHPSIAKINRGKLLSKNSLEEIIKEEGDYNRYLLTSDGISPRALPGISGVTFMSDTYEHNEKGFAEEQRELRNAQMEKRMRKLATMESDGLLPLPIQSFVLSRGKEVTKIGFIGYGGVYGPIREAQEKLAEEGVTSHFLLLGTLWPFPGEEVRRFIRKMSRVFVVEQNISGQLRSLIQKEATGLMPRKLKSILRYDGRPFQPKDIVKGVERSFN